ncbi:hypothetical protein Syun_022735 [Stephania yunnanensis]|uniref:EF-hand domain-containing protein n=1 Tax=Stephania yunnanensis TaxID=152371 RepID=A0AAP0I3D1_9MAGN
MTDTRAASGDLASVFNHFDANKDGKISSSELSDVLRAIGTAASPEDLRQMMEEMDRDGDGYIDLAEFEEFHRGSDGGEETQMREMRSAFEAYDRDRNGVISAKELHMVLARLGEGFSVEDCVRMIEGFDSDGDGNISFDEFQRMMAKTSTTSDGNGS